jgi:hypothetical protein
VKDNRAACAFVLATQDRGIKALRDMEQAGSRLSGPVLRMLEPMQIREDFERLAGLMDPALGKPTVARMREKVREILSSRWWKWCLLHPEIPETLLHRTRSMQLPAPPSLPGRWGVQGQNGRGVGWLC